MGEKKKKGLHITAGEGERVVTNEKKTGMTSRRSKRKENRIKSRPSEMAFERDTKCLKEQGKKKISYRGMVTTHT